MTQVFISYSRRDLAFVEQLAADLKSNGLDVWYDLSGLEGGDRWSRAIEQAIRDSQFVIVVLSPDSNESEWVEKEFIFASSLRRKIIPLLHRACDPRLTYVNLHYIDVQGDQYKRNFNRILHALNAQPKVQIAPVQKPAEEKKSIAPKYTTFPPVIMGTQQPKNLAYENKLTLSNGMEFMHVPAGKFLMGSKKDNQLAKRNEKNQCTIHIPYDYWTARFSVTNEFYSVYVKAKRMEHPVDGWEKKRNHPVVHVYKDVVTYCDWLNGLLKSELPSGLVLRLPTEAEWEKSARGENGNEWPWGNKFCKNKCNSSESGKGDTTQVGLYSPEGDSPYGCADMVGNVWEITHSLWKKYPYNVADGREDVTAYGYRVLRGGSFHDPYWITRCAFRGSYEILDTLPDYIVDILDDFDSNSLIGFRVTLAPPLSEIVKL